MSEELHTPEQWQAITGVTIHDPDGWRIADAPSWDAPISRDEFERRAVASTITPPPVAPRQGS